MMITFREVVSKTKRDDQESNDTLHWFSSKFSSYFSWIFINLKLTADHVTIIFFTLGTLGALSLLLNTYASVIISYLLYRFHIIVDMADGDVARYNNKFTIRGVYWDSMAHSFINPLFFINGCILLYQRFDQIYFLLISPFICLIVSLFISTKNNYLKANYLNNIPKTKRKKLDYNFIQKLILFISLIFSIEGFIPFLFLSILIDNIHFSVVGITLFCVSIFFGSLIKFLNSSYKGYTLRKN